MLQEQTHEVKIVEDFSDLDASNVSDDIAENTQDTTTLLEKYVDELDTEIDKPRLKNTLKSLYLEVVIWRYNDNILKGSLEEFLSTEILSQRYYLIKIHQH